MALETVGSLGYGGERLNTRLPRMVAELQGHTISGPLTGAAANTAILVADGISVSDTVQKALMFAAGVPSDITSTITVVDLRASGTVTLSSAVAGDTVTVNGKVYTLANFWPTPTYNAPPQTILSGAYFVSYASTNSIPAAQQQALLAAFLAVSLTQAAALIAGGADYITAADLANTIQDEDALLANTSSAANVVTVKATYEGTAANAYTLAISAHGSVSGATLAGGNYGVQFGTVTAATVVATNTVTVNGVVYTAVASTGGPYAFNQFPSVPTAADLVGIGYAPGAAATLALTPNSAVAAFLAHQINASQGSVELVSLNGGTTNVGITAVANAAVVTLTATNDNVAVLTLASSGATLTVSGANFTAGGREIKSTTNSTGNTIVLFWYRKPRQVGAM